MIRMSNDFNSLRGHYVSRWRICRFYLIYMDKCRLAPGGCPLMRLKARLKAAWEV